jgi:hypothetical protein
MEMKSQREQGIKRSRLQRAAERCWYAADAGAADAGALPATK